MFRGRDLDIKYLGMIPSSLELNKLVSLGMKTTTKKSNEKLLSSDIINVKFRQKVDSGKQVIKKLKDKIAKIEEKKEYCDKLHNFIKLIQSEIELQKWSGVSQSALREKLYTEGFTLNGTKYVVYKRSSAKSRIGQCLFIKENCMNQ